MLNGDQRLDVVLFQFVQNIGIKFQTCFVGSLFQTGGEDTAPADGEPVDVEAHTGHQCNILLVMVVEVHGFVTGIIFVLVQMWLRTFREAFGVEKAAFYLGIAAVRQNQGRAARVVHTAVHLIVMGGKSASAFLISAFNLEIGRCAAPQKILG